MIIDTSPQEPAQLDLTELYLSFKEKYRNLFMIQLGNQPFFYRALGRKEYRDLMSNKEVSDYEKEDILCEVCTVWPEDFDWEDCDAGVPRELAKAILKNSFLDSSDARKTVLSYYRSEMYDLDNQITCIINEAFPSYDIEEIETWDVEKTMKYLSRAEWKLHNFQGLQFKEPEGDFYEPNKEESPQSAAQESESYEDHDDAGTDARTIRGGSKADKLTPDKMRELAELKRKFPEIDWEHDLGTQGIQGLEQDTVDTTAPALRPGW